MVFMEKDMKLLLTLNSFLMNPEKAIKKELRNLCPVKKPRIDIVSVTANRLAYLLSPNYIVQKEHISAFQDFMTCSAEDKNGVPEDIAHASCDRWFFQNLVMTSFRSLKETRKLSIIGFLTH